MRNAWEWWRDRYYEGPTPPTRLTAAVKTFAAMHPRASRAQWIEFASHFAGEAYRTGYVRGLEWCERDLDRRDPMVDPEVLAANERHDMSWVGLQPDDEQVADIQERFADVYEHLSPEQQALYMDTLGREMGTYRIEGGDPPKR